MVQFSGKITHLDPAPYIAYGDSSHGRFEDYLSAFEFARGDNDKVEYAPRPEFDYKPSNLVNPILVAASESYDPSDPWGQALNWLEALAPFIEAIADESDSYETQTVISLYNNDGQWNLPQATEEHIHHAARVFDKLADVARANGLHY